MLSHSCEPGLPAQFQLECFRFGSQQAVAVPAPPCPVPPTNSRLRSQQLWTWVVASPPPPLWLAPGWEGPWEGTVGAPLSKGTLTLDLTESKGSDRSDQEDPRLMASWVFPLPGVSTSCMTLES